ncbi:hypothetical protein PISMIDRAFT_675838, partial [Pisolithus microcarpus 441]
MWDGTSASFPWNSALSWQVPLCATQVPLFMSSSCTVCGALGERSTLTAGSLPPHTAVAPLYPKASKASQTRSRES